MNLTSGRTLALLAALAAGDIGAARAEIYALSYLESNDRLTVRELPSTASTAGGFNGCCAVAVGTATPDAVNNRIWFVRPDPAGDELRGLRYGSGTSLTLPLTPGYRVTHLEWDAAGNQLLGLALDLVTDRYVPVRVAPATGTITLLGVLAPDCCTIRAGVSVLTRNGDPRVIAIGRRSADTVDQFLVFNFTSGTLETAVPVSDGLLVNELVRHPVTNVVYGLAYAPAVDKAQPFTLDGALAITAIGAGVDGCCFALAGGAAIERNSNTLVVLSAAFGGAAFNARAFDLATGLASDGPVLGANLLFEDSGVVVGVLFGDGFE